MSKTSIHFFALAAHGKGISGGDRIWIEFAKNWSKKYPITIYLWEEGYEMLKRQQLVSEKGKVKSEKLKIQISRMKTWSHFGFIINYFARIVEGIRLGLVTKLENSQETTIYSASEFWMDSLPAFILKLKYSKIRWVAAWYQTAPNPLRGFSGSLPYWLVQLPIKPLVNKFADFSLVNNDEEKKEFPKLNQLKRVIVVLGAIDLTKINQYKKTHTELPKKYEAVFQGRFHPQKGVLELIDIWAQVVKQKPNAKLVMIGDGPLMESVKNKVQSAKLDKKITFKGFLFEGEEKYSIFAHSRIVVHPAIFDSGGMASAEAMAFGLPCVGFNLHSYKYYYPKGMIKVPLKNLDSFAAKIIELLSDENLYRKISKEALQLINNTWSWEYRSGQILQAVLE